LGEGFHEGLGSGLGDGTQVSDEFLLGHTDTSVSEGEGVGCLVGDDFDLEVGFISGDVGVSHGFVSDLVQGVRCVGNQLSEEDLLVGIECVDDQTHQLLDVSIEGEVLSFLLNVLGHFLKDF
jgi:hypothetical protein